MYVMQLLSILKLRITLECGDISLNLNGFQ